MCAWQTNQTESINHEEKCGKRGSSTQHCTFAFKQGSNHHALPRLRYSDNEDRANPYKMDERTAEMWRTFVRNSKLTASKKWWDPKQEDDNKPLPDTYFDLNA